MKTCPNCGNQVADEALFCNNCGTNVANVAGSASAASGTVNPTPSDVDAAAKAVDEAATDAVNQMTGAQPEVQGFQGQFSQQPVYRNIDPSDHTAEFDPRDIADNKLFAVLPYFTFGLGIIVALLVRESAYTKFHAKNAIRLEIAAILAVIPAIIPVLGWIITCILLVALVIVQIIAIINVFQGKAKDLPIVGNIGFLK